MMTLADFVARLHKRYSEPKDWRWRLDLETMGLTPGEWYELVQGKAGPVVVPWEQRPAHAGATGYKRVTSIESNRLTLESAKPPPAPTPIRQLRHTCDQPSFGYPQGKMFDCELCRINQQLVEPEPQPTVAVASDGTHVNKCTNPTHMVMCNDFSGCVFVKEYSFFVSQKGHIQDWGRNWKPVHAESIEHARELGCLMFSKARPYEDQAKS